MRGPSRIERYVLSRNLAAVGAVSAIVASVAVLLEFVEVSRTVGSRGEAGFAAIMGLSFLKAPSTILSLLPFVFLFGAVSAFISLNRGSELVAMRASGVSAWRFIFPTAFTAFFVGLLVVTLAGPFAAGLGTRFEQARGVALGAYQAAAPRETWLRQDDGRSVLYIQAKSSARNGDDVVLRDVVIAAYAKGDNDRLTFARQIDAREARLSGGAWQLLDAVQSRPGADSVQSEFLAIASDLDPKVILEQFAGAETVDFWRLPRTIAETERSGLSATAHRLRWQQLLATPLLYAAMTILAAAFSLRLMRRGNLGLLAGVGVAIGFAVFFIAQLCAALGKADALSPVLAAWAPPVGALLVGFTLLCYTEDG